MENQKFELSQEYFDKVTEAASKKLVGEILSNVETIKSNKDELKQSIKNTVYQNFRDLKAQLEAFNDGVKFIYSPKTTK